MSGGTLYSGSNEIVRARPIAWSIGPFHADLSGAYRLHLQLDGELVREAEIETGFTRRSVEAILTRQTWRGAIPFLDRVDPEAALFYEWCFCLAAEQLGGIETPARGRGIRVILGELSRVSSHLLHLAKVSRAAGSEAAFHLLLRDRERILDLLELLSGARHALAFLLPGGVREDVTDGFLERVQETSQQILQRVKEYNDLLTYNEAFVRRVGGRGVIGRELVEKHNISGIPAKVFSPLEDLRVMEEGRPHFGARLTDIGSVEAVATAGDAHHRFVYRLHEVVQSAQLLMEMSQRLPSGPYRQKQETASPLPAGRATASVEAPRGRLSVALASDGEKPGPTQVEFSTPSVPLHRALPEYLSETAIQDLSLLLHSLDLQITEVDK